MRGWPSQKAGSTSARTPGGGHRLVVVGGARGHVGVRVEDPHAASWMRDSSALPRPLGGRRTGSELGLDRGDLLRRADDLSMTVQTSAGDVAAGGDALVHERGEHPRAVRRDARRGCRPAA